MSFNNLFCFVAFDNDFDTDERAWSPEVWAQETLALLEENMVAAHLVHTDFSNEVKDFGDTVNTRKPGKFVAQRKGVNDDVTIQAAEASKVPVVLNQHVHTSFMIRDGEESRSIANLIDEYMRPAAMSLANHVDKILLGQVYQFLDNSVGDIGEGDATENSAHNLKNLMLDTRNEMNTNLCPVNGRNMILSSNAETLALKLNLFITADKVGDEGTALREASLGRKLNFDCYMCQNVPSVTDDAVVDADDVAVVVAGATAFTSDDADAAYSIGQYIYFVDGTTDTVFDKTPHRVIKITGEVVTLDRPIRVDLVANSDSYKVPMCDVALTEHGVAGGPAAYPEGYDKAIWVDGSGTPRVGQLVSFNNGATVLSAEYCIISVTETAGGEYAIVLDRPLEDALEDGFTVGLGPGGDYNFAFTRGALALVNRPLALPRAGLGANGAVASYNGLSMRVVMTYQGKEQGTLVTMDLLCGVKVLDVDQGAVLIS